MTPRPFLVRVLAAVAVVLGLFVGHVTTAPSAFAWDDPEPTRPTYTETFSSGPRLGIGGPQGATTWGLSDWVRGPGALEWHPVTGGTFGTPIWLYGRLSSLDVGCVGLTSGECFVSVHRYDSQGVGSDTDPIWLNTATTSVGRFKRGTGVSSWAVALSAGLSGEFFNDARGNGATVTVAPGSAHDEISWWGFSCRVSSSSAGHCSIDNLAGLATEWYAPEEEWCPEGDPRFPLATGDSSSVWPVGSTCGAEPQPAPVVPQLACGRTMRDLGGGQWVADVEAIVRNPATTGAYTDTAGSWRTSWDAGHFLGKTTSIPLPAGAQPGEGRRATYTMAREYEVGTHWDMPAAMAPRVTEETDLEVSYGVVLPITWAVEAIARRLGGEDIDAGDVVGAGGTLTAEAPDGSMPGVPTIGTEIRRLWARCFVNIDPPESPEDAGTTTWIIINLPDNPDDPNPPPTTIEDFAPVPIADSTCGGWSWNPLNMAKNLGCFLEQLWQWFLDLPQTIIGWVVPDLADVQAVIDTVRTKAEGKVPFSWIGALFDAFGGDAWAMESPTECEAPLDPSQNPSQLPNSAHDIYLRAALCDGDGPGKSRGATATSAVFTVLIWGAVGGRIWDSAPWNRGKDGGGPS